MAEYIEKAALMGLIEFEARRWGDDYDWWQCLADIEDFKPADVRPVVRGKWIPVTNGRGGSECNLCHAYAPSYQSGAEYNSPFCPNCGADMRETKE